MAVTTEFGAHQGFRSEILADPHNVSLRLIYADWLEELNDTKDLLLPQDVMAVEQLRCPDWVQFDGVGDLRSRNHVDGNGQNVFHPVETTDFPIPDCWKRDYVGNVRSMGSMIQPSPNGCFDNCHSLRIHHGMISQVRMDADAWWEYGGEIIGTHPIVEVMMTSYGPWHDRVYSPLFSWKKSLVDFEENWPHISFDCTNQEY